jgi:hypothetical protein
VDPKRARRIMANRLSAAKSKLRQKNSAQVGFSMLLRWLEYCGSLLRHLSRQSSDRLLSRRVLLSAPDCCWWRHTAA